MNEATSNVTNINDAIDLIGNLMSEYGIAGKIWQRSDFDYPTDIDYRGDTGMSDAEYANRVEEAMGIAWDALTDCNDTEWDAIESAMKQAFK